MHPAELLLEALAKTQLTTQTFRDNPNATGYPTIRHEPLHQQLPQLTRDNQRGMGIYLMVNDGNGLGRRTENVTRPTSHFIDLDGQPLPQRWPLDPTIIIQTSPGRYHAYWTITDAPLNTWTHAQQHIATHYHADPVVHDLPRVMRLPGFHHHKTNTPTIIQITHYEPLAIYTSVDFWRWHKIPEPPPPRRPLPQVVIDYINRKKGMPSRAAQAPQERTLDTAAIRIAGAPNGTRNQTLYRVASAVAAQVRAGEIRQDDAERQLHLAGLAAGLEEHEIRASIRSAMRHAK